MTRPSRIAVLGAGSLRCAPEVLATLIRADLPEESAIWLSDEFEEGLQLAEMLASRLIQDSGQLLRVVATTSAEESLEGADTVILCYGGGLWHRGGVSMSALGEHLEVLRLHRLLDVFETVNRCLASEERPVTVINLSRPVQITAKLLQRPAIHLDWPLPLGVDERVPRAHQILRWARGEDPTHALLESVVQSPLFAALRYGEPAPRLAFDPDASDEIREQVRRLGPEIERLILEL